MLDPQLSSGLARKGSPQPVISGRASLPVEAGSCQRGGASEGERAESGRSERELESRQKNVFHEAACRDTAAGIMAGREFSAASQNQTFAEASGRRRTFLRSGRDGVCLRRGLRRVPLPRRGEPPAVRTSHGHAVLRGAAEKWENPIHLQPTGGANLCPHAVSP